MPQRAATIESLPMAFALVKEMQADGLEWGEGYRPLGRQALAEIIQRLGLQAGHGKAIFELGRVPVEVDVLPEPIEGDFQNSARSCGRHGDHGKTVPVRTGG